MYLYKFGQNPTIDSDRRYDAEKVDFYSLYRLATLKIKSRSPKSNQFFIVSHIYNISSLVRIHHSVQELACGNKLFVRI